MAMYETPKFLSAGDRAVVIELGDSISPECNRRVHNLVAAVEKKAMPEIVDLVPTYRSLLVLYDPIRVTHAEMEERLSAIEHDLVDSEAENIRVVHLPTLYGGEYGPDLEFVAENAGLTVEEVVETHSGTDYLVYMMGFTPGFPYLGGMDEKLAAPRLKTPRGKIPAGSVGIAESQTGVYPMESPGGWRLIGRTPLRLFDARREPPSLVQAGDYVHFAPVSSDEEYRRIESAVAAGEYDLKVTTKE